MNSVAIYPGTFDPITNGHIDILLKASEVFDTVILAVAENSGKNSYFSIEERTKLCTIATKDIPRVQVKSFQGLVVDFAKTINASVMIRGLRAVSDFEYELQLALMNKKLCKDINTMFLVPDSKYLYLSSSLIKQITQLGGELDEFIPLCVKEALNNKHKILD